LPDVNTGVLISISGNISPAATNPLETGAYENLDCQEKKVDAVQIKQGNTDRTEKTE